MRQLKAPAVKARILAARSSGTSSADGVPVAAFPAMAGLHTMPAAGAHPVRIVRVPYGHKPAGALALHSQELPAACRGHGNPGALSVACENGHIDDFPWDEYLHGDGSVSGPSGIARS